MFFNFNLLLVVAEIYSSKNEYINKSKSYRSCREQMQVSPFCSSV